MYYKSLEEITRENDSRETLFQSQSYEIIKLDKKLEQLEIEMNSRKVNIENIPSAITADCNFLIMLGNIKNVKELKSLYQYYGANYLITPNMLDQIMWTFPRHFLNKHQLSIEILNFLETLPACLHKLFAKDLPLIKFV